MKLAPSRFDDFSRASNVHFGGWTGSLSLSVSQMCPLARLPAEVFY